MAEPTTKTSNLYALLIGIDYYLPGKLPDGSYYKNLGGCVRDINRVEAYLNNTLHPQQILKLTSSNTGATEPPEPQEQLPTYENIVAKFQQLTEIAQKDDQVYIHYSGHGGRAKTVYPELKGAGQPDEALVPMDIANSNSRYLRDVELAALLKKMVDKELVVTVVLDSCHSGGTTRGDTEIRGLEGEPDQTSRPTDSLVASREELIQNWRELTGGTTRKAHTGDWLPESNEYVLLAACRPSEYAYEHAFNGKERNGALTYWLLDTLNNRSSDLTYQLLYDRIYAKVQSQFQTQTPMLFGKGERQVFGSSDGELHYTVNVIKVNTTRNQVLLNAGKAQGIGKGARFAIYPPGTTDFTKNKPLAIAEVTAIISEAEAEANIEPDSFDYDEIPEGSPAIMLSPPIALVRRIRLFDKPEDQVNQGLSPEVAKIQSQALQAVQTAIPRVGKGWVELASEDEAEHYQIAINADGEYEICDPSGTPLPNLRPPLKVSDIDAAESVILRLVHLTKYQAAQELDNSATNKLLVQLTDEHKQPLADPTKQTLRDGEPTYLYLKNESNQVLNVVVLNLQSNWAITQFDILQDGSDFVPFNPGQEELIDLDFVLPDGCKEGKEILKVFATAKPAKFRWLELPSLDQPIQTKKAAIEKYYDDYDENTPRGSGSDPLDKLLQAVGADIDEAPPTREARVRGSNRGWMTKTVTITVTAN
jgi:Caspase domain